MTHFFRLFAFVILFIPLQLVHTHSLESRFEALQTTDFGVQATHSTFEDLEKLVSPIPLSATGKSYLTMNKMGFDVLNSESQKNWVLFELLQFLERGSNLKVLDVGCGYGRISHLALKNQALTIANDLAIEHLVHTRKIAHEEGLNIENLYLNNHSFPQDTSFKEESLDAVVLYRMIHFLSPAEIELGLSKVFKWLKRGGKVFIVVLAPQHKGFSHWFLPLYESKWNSGDVWPGAGLEVAKALPAQQYNLPTTLHVMDERPLRHALEKQGFEVEKKGFIDMSRFGQKQDPHRRDGRESFGLVAIKKN